MIDFKLSPIEDLQCKKLDSSSMNQQRINRINKIIFIRNELNRKPIYQKRYLWDQKIQKNTFILKQNKLIRRLIN
tara:strand:+ start:114 stop:338 length:225 start_codon:yes stop_codon:yes gene_type:complete